MAQKNKFGFAEVVDTFSDVIKAVIGFLGTIEGGFNLVSFFQYALKTYPDLKEVVEDFGTFTAELLDLTPQEALDAVGEIDGRTPDHPVANKIVGFLKIAAVSYDFVDKTIGRVKGISEMIKDFFGSDQK